MWRSTVFLVATMVGLAGCATGTADVRVSGGTPLARVATREMPFWLGADVGWIPEDEAAGATYFDHGVRGDPVSILAEHGFNAMRIRVFVDPKSPRGYARRMPQAFGDLEHGLGLARRAKANGMAILIDLMFSDSWADPEHQPKPAAWEGLSVKQLAGKAHDHAREVVAALEAQGTPPAMVQVGNEITHGMLWPEARVASAMSSGNAATDARMHESGIEGLGHYDELATVLREAIAGVHEVDPKVQIALHHHLGRSTERVEEWMDELGKRGVRPDVVALSCYAQGKEGDWDRTFHALVAKYPVRVLAVEYSARKRDVNDLVYGLPEGRGVGTFIWEPTRHREALFDQGGVNAGGGQASNFVQELGIGQGATSQPGSRPASRARVNRGGRFDANAFMELYPEMARNFGLRMGDPALRNRN